MTDNLAVSYLMLPGLNQEGTVGPAYPGLKDRIDSKTGEIQMFSATLMRGYNKESELTRKAFTANSRTCSKPAGANRWLPRRPKTSWSRTNRWMPAWSQVPASSARWAL